MRLLLISSALFIVALIATGPARAATAEPPRAIEEIVVTAQKRAQSLQDVPVSVTALSGTDLEAFKYRDATDIAAQVPNLQAASTVGDGFPIFSLRGVSMSDFSFNQSSPVASYVDEVYKGNPAIQGVQLYDLERIEVLRGPQGTLYGKNTTGGAVNFITRRPEFQRGGYLFAGAGSYGRLESHGAYELPLIDDKLTVRAAGTWTEADGWFQNQQPGVEDGNAIDEYGARLSVLWLPTEGLDVLLRASTGKQDEVNYGIQPFNISSDGVGGGLYGLYGLLGAGTATDYTREDRDFFEFDSDQDARRRIENDALALTLNWDVAEALTVTSITSWDDGEIFNPEDADGSPNVVVRPYYSGSAEQVSQDLRITSSYDGPFNFILGAYWSDEDVHNSTRIGFWQDLDLNTDGTLDFNDCLDPTYTLFGLGQATASGAATEAVLNGFGLSLADFFPAGCQAANEFDQQRTTLAGYFDGSLDLNSAFTLRFGLRYTEDEAKLENFSARLLGNDGVALVNTIPGDPADPFATQADQNFTDREWSGRFGIDYVTDAGTLLYASYSRGYRSGAYNAQAFFDPAELTRVEPETLNSYELGVKSEWFDRSLRLNGAAFFYDYENQQFLNVDAATAAQTLVNIDASEVLGAELEVLWQPTGTLLLSAGLGWLDSEVTDGTLSGVDLEGNQLLLAPELNLNLAADWDVLSLPVGVLTAHLDATYLDDHYFEIFNLERLRQDGYWVGNARLTLEAHDAAWQVAVWMKNLADEEYRTSAIDLAAFGYDYSHIGAPRTWGAEFTYRF